MSRSSLTGSWSGAYRYPRGILPETVFSAVIEERDGALVGSTQEPNVLRRTPGAVITADIDGVRRGLDVTFTKYMDGSGGMRHAIRYGGTADAKLTRIDGTWTIPGDWSGTFFMTRDDNGEEAEAKAAAEAETNAKP
jgi:hypothetical protein